MGKGIEIYKVVGKIMLGIIFLVLLRICLNVDLYGDDLFYTQFTIGDLKYYIERNYEHYFLANGRVIVHLLVTFFLGIPMIFWQILNPVMITLIIYFINKVVNKGKNLGSILGIGISGIIFMSIHINITRQSVYWLTGSFNYIYPLLTMLLYWYWIDNIKDGDKLYKYMPVVAFFASQSTEQGSMMSLGIMVLSIMERVIIKGQKIDKIWYISLVVNIIGLLTVVLAPGVSNRIDQTNINMTFIELLIENLQNQSTSLFYGGVLIKTHLLLLGIKWLYVIIVMKNDIRKWVTLTLASVIMLIYVGIYRGAYIVGELSSVLNNVVIIMYIIIGLIIGYSEYKERGENIVIKGMILGYGSQIMMIVSPVYGNRIYISYIIMEMLISSRIMGEIGESIENRIEIREKIRFMGIIIGMVMMIITVKGGESEYKGYNTNHKVYQENIEALKGGIRVQKRMPLYAYMWNMPYEGEYYKPYYNLSHGIGQNEELEWIMP